MSEFLRKFFTRKLRVGDPLEPGTVPVDEPGGRRVLPGVSTIVKIVDVKGTDVKELLNSLTENQTLLSGENLLDDPRRKGKIDSKKLYVLEQ